MNFREFSPNGRLGHEADWPVTPAVGRERTVGFEMSRKPKRSFTVEGLCLLNDIIHETKAPDK